MGQSNKYNGEVENAQRSQFRLKGKRQAGIFPDRHWLTGTKRSVHTHSSCALDSYICAESDNPLVPEQIQIDETDGVSVLRNRFTLVRISFYGSLPRMDIKKNGFNLSLRLIGVLLSFWSSPF